MPIHKTGVQLSPHFSLDELIYSDTALLLEIDNSPSLQAVVNLTLLANQTLEKIRQICGANPVTITSGYRCPDLNAAVGGASDSAHLSGRAADIVIPDYGDPLKVCQAIQQYVGDLHIDQLIYETSSDGGVWVHVGRGQIGKGYRCQCFSIINGATEYEPFPTVAGAWG